MSNVRLTASDTITGQPNVSRVVAAASTNINLLKATPGNVYGFVFYNTAAYDVFVKFYNKATAAVLASDTPLFTVKCKAGVETTYSSSYGIPFSTGVGYAAVKLIADSDVTVLVANDITGAIFWF